MLALLSPFESFLAKTQGLLPVPDVDSFLDLPVPSVNDLVFDKHHDRDVLSKGVPTQDHGAHKGY